jgi:hypothetical protein
VEVHNGGSLSEETPTFKWSRENGSVVFPIKGIKSNDTDAVTLELESLGCNDRFGLTVNDWVEIEDDVSVLNNEVKPLLQVQKLDSFEMTVTLKKKAGVNYNLKIEDLNPDAHALLRRWDQKKEVTNEGVLKIVESSVPDEDWLDIENGIKIQFQPGGTYRTGDYWLISARTALGDVEWPEGVDDQGNSTPKYLSPHGVMHHLAPLAIISVEGKDLELKHDCRCNFSPLSDYCAYNYYGQLGIGVDLLCPE